MKTSSLHECISKESRTLCKNQQVFIRFIFLENLTPQLKKSHWTYFKRSFWWKSFDCSGEDFVSAVDSLGAEDGETRGEDHEEDNNDAEQDEGAGSEGEVVQVAAGQCSWHGWWFCPVLATAPHSHSPSSAPEQHKQC